MKISESGISKLKAFREREYQNEVEGKSEKQQAPTKRINLLLDPFVAKVDKQKTIVSNPINTQTNDNKNKNKRVVAKIRRSKSYDDIRKEEQKTNKFKARKMPNFTQKFEPLKPKKKLTIPKPFNFQTAKRARSVETKLLLEEPKGFQATKIAPLHSKIVKKFKFDPK